MKNFGKNVVPINTEKKKNVGKKEQGGDYYEKWQHYFIQVGVYGISGQVVDDEKIQQDEADKDDGVERID